MTRMILLNLPSGAGIESQGMCMDVQEGDPRGRVTELSGLGVEERYRGSGSEDMGLRR